MKTSECNCHQHLATGFPAALPTRWHPFSDSLLFLRVNFDNLYGLFCFTVPHISVLRKDRMLAETSPFTSEQVAHVEHTIKKGHFKEGPGFRPGRLAKFSLEELQMSSFERF